MSLLLSGSKTITIAGTVMQCIELYTGESYTLPFAFKDADGLPIDCTGWTLGTTAKWYTTNLTYPDDNTVNVADLSLDSPQPGSGASTGLTAAFTTQSSGLGYIYIPSVISGGAGSPPSPIPTLLDNPSILVIITLTITRTDSLSGLSDVNREPIGIVVRYQ